MSGRRARSRSRSVEIVPPGGHALPLAPAQTRIRLLETMVQLLSQGLSMEREGVHILNGRVRDLVGENRDLNSQVRELNAQVQDLTTEVDSMRNSVLRLLSTQELLGRTVSRSLGGSLKIHRDS